MNKKVSFECEAITPLFMFGAEAASPELRPSEFKGMMRFWWRATKAEADLSKLREEEGKIFGWAGEREAERSSFLLRIRPGKMEVGAELWDEIKYETKTGKGGKTWKEPKEDFKGLHYLFYSTLLPKEEKPYFKPGSKFTLILQGENLKEAVASLWISIFLGSFGTRARRGAGSLKVNNVNTEIKELSFQPQAEGSSQLAAWIIENFEKAQKIIAGGKAKDFVSEYSNLSFSRFILAREGKEDWKDALKEVGQIYRDFRTKHKSKILEVASFGIPIMHRKRGEKGKKSVIAEYEGKKLQRRASPLWFKVIFSKGKYYWMVTRLAGEFLPKGGVVEFLGKKQKPSYDLLEDFWNNLRSKGREYMLSQPQRLEEIKEKLAELTAASKIYLFGSKARGDFHKDSDLDLAIEGERVWEAEFKEGNLDIVDLGKMQNKSLWERIEREGVLIYERKTQKKR